LIESPNTFSLARQGRVLVQTLDHNLVKVQDGDIFGKVTVNNAEKPKHVLFSSFQKGTNYECYDYFAWQPEGRVV